MSVILIEEKNPLKQGLKQVKRASLGGDHRIEEKNPLKQGLKPMKFTHRLKQKGD